MRRYEVSIDVEPHVVTVCCCEDDIRIEVIRKLLNRDGADREEIENLEVEDWIDLSQLQADDDAVSEHYDMRGGEL